MTVDDAFNHLVATLKNGEPLNKFGYEVYLEEVIWSYLRVHEKVSPKGLSDYPAERRRAELSPYFYAAAWELCRRGILRPGVKWWGEQATTDGSGGNGYCITPFGREWLPKADNEALSAVIPGRFVELLSAHVKRFGPGYLSRGTEAIRCYNAHAFLASCAMCGAAAESILLALASERKGPDEVLRTYGNAGGRSRIENLLVGQADDRVKREFHGFMVLLSYWRDEAAHGRASTISETEAFTSLMLLLRLGKYADETFPVPKESRSRRI